MDFRHFRYFVTAAEELHFARAAERLGIAQPALSQQIKVLEEQLGVRLFSREKKSVQLTEAGRAFLGEARATLACADKAVSIARETARGELGKIAIGFVGSAMYKPTISHLLKDFRGQHPGVALELHEIPNLRQIESVEALHLDIAIVRGLGPNGLPDGLSSFVLGSHRLMAVLPDHHPLASVQTLNLAQLAKEPFLSLDDLSKISLTPLLMQLCHDAGFEPNIQMRLSEIATLIHLVGAGHGVGIMPDLAACLNLPDVHFVPLEGVPVYSDLLAIYRRFERSAAVRALVAEMRKAAPI
jgi:DNA-binding transcriptional LysR family regulator